MCAPTPPKPDPLIGQAAMSNAELESPRVLRRLQHLREWSHEKIKQVFPRGT